METALFEIDEGDNGATRQEIIEHPRVVTIDGPENEGEDDALERSTLIRSHSSRRSQQSQHSLHSKSKSKAVLNLEILKARLREMALKPADDNGENVNLLGDVSGGTQLELADARQQMSLAMLSECSFSASDLIPMTAKQRAAMDTKKRLARSETNVIKFLRTFTILVLFLATVGTSIFVYMRVNQIEGKKFEAEFMAQALKMHEGVQLNIEKKLSSIDALSLSVTSHALSGDGFPNVTIPDFEVRGASTRTLGDMLMVYFLPVVTNETRLGWEAYARQEQVHNLQSFNKENSYRTAQDEKVLGLSANEKRKMRRRNGTPSHDTEIELGKTVDGFSNGIYGRNPGAGPGPGPFLPIWQMSPVLPLPAILKFDVSNEPYMADGRDAVLNNGKVVIEKMVGPKNSNVNADDQIDLFNAFLSLNQYRHNVTNYDEEWGSPILYPVYNNFENNATVAGILSTAMYWRLLFSNILPSDAKGIICVLRNSGGQSITYKVDGSLATFLGQGDKHDTKYDHLKNTADISDRVSNLASVETLSYTRADLCVECISYEIDIYPSKITESKFSSNYPLIYAVIVGTIFIGTSTVFLLFDMFVRKRHQIVMDRTMRTTALVSSLFPEAVRDQLLSREDHIVPEGNKKIGRGSIGGGASVTSEEEEIENHSSTNIFSGKPIASKFPATTVFFADLAGFTKWSSTREPEHVFLLLENLYHEFDDVALRRGVFKVETIGDCYMAVTGLPEPQPDHAIIMAKFALTCLRKLEDVINRLTPELGEGTRDLALRVGLHSGHVTGGVLRGDKGRFQLFGDTVNTASRMESNGIKGRVHCSESTAIEIRKAGLEHWLTEREDKITAKGKGIMDTYWIGMKAKSKGNPDPEEDDVSVAENVQKLKAALTVKKQMMMKLKFINKLSETSQAEDSAAMAKNHVDHLRRATMGMASIPPQVSDASKRSSISAGV